MPYRFLKTKIIGERAVRDEGETKNRKRETPEIHEIRTSETHRLDFPDRYLLIKTRYKVRRPQVNKSWCGR